MKDNSPAPGRRGPTRSWRHFQARIQLFQSLAAPFLGVLTSGRQALPIRTGRRAPRATGRRRLRSAPNSSKPNPNQTKPDQDNGLGLSWIPSSDSGLFNGLRAAQSNRGKFPGEQLCCVGSDESCEVWDSGSRETQAIAKVVEERDSEFRARLGEAEHDVASAAAFFGDGSAGDFALGDAGPDVVFGGVGVESDFRPLE